MKYFTKIYDLKYALIKTRCITSINVYGNEIFFLV